MLSYQLETLFDVIGEVEGLLHLHYQELCLNQDVVKLNPNWERYRALESMGAFVVYTARRDGLLIGYSAFFVNQHLHYMDLTTGVNDVLFIHPEHRLGRAGMGLIRYSERQLTQWLGEVKVVWRAKLGSLLADILPRMGYTPEEITFGKIFSGN